MPAKRVVSGGRVRLRSAKTAGIVERTSRPETRLAMRMAMKSPTGNVCFRRAGGGSTRLVSRLHDSLQRYPSNYQYSYPQFSVSDPQICRAGRSSTVGTSKSRPWLLLSIDLGLNQSRQIS